MCMKLQVFQRHVVVNGAEAIKQDKDLSYSRHTSSNELIQAACDGSRGSHHTSWFRPRGGRFLEQQLRVSPQTALQQHLMRVMIGLATGPRFHSSSDNRQGRIRPSDSARFIFQPNLVLATHHDGWCPHRNALHISVPPKGTP